MVRFGCALQLHHKTTDTTSALYARCVVAQHAGLGVVRIPHHHHITLAPHAIPQLRAYIHTHRLRIVVHAPFAHITQLTSQLECYATLFDALACYDAVIICHVSQLNTSTADALMALPDTVRAYVALEHTYQSPIHFAAFANAVALPPIFDWLHYHIQAPWPYCPIETACTWAQQWGTRPALFHMSSLATHGRAGTHGDVIDSSVVIWLLRSMRTHGVVADIELETPAGLRAFARLRHELAHKAPDLMMFANKGVAHE